MKKYIFLFLLLLYLCIHLINLTLLPIFNDEAIYLSWGWTAIHIPGEMYISLTDAKQPFMIWLFGIFADIFPDPLFGGRIVSVFWGIGSMVGIYMLARKLFDTKVAYVAMGLFAITPLFVFYNRQALMESGLVCLGIWTCLYLLQVIQKPTVRNSVLLGALLGVSFFIKSSGLIFLLTAVLVLLLSAKRKRTKEYLAALCLMLSVSVFTSIPLFVQPDFWSTWSTNSRYAYPLSELLRFPVTVWITNVGSFFAIIFFFVTPMIGILSLYGLYALRIRKKPQYTPFLIFLGSIVFFELILVKEQTTRYLVSFLPLLLIPAAYMLTRLWRQHIIGKGIAVISLFLPIMSTVSLLLSPVAFIHTMSAVTPYAGEGYIKGWTSGIGVNETMQYLRDKTSNTMLVFTLPNTGNPENAIEVYSYKTANIVTLPIEAQFFSSLETVECFESVYPAFLVTRDMQMAGLEDYFVLEKSIQNPYSDYSIKIHRLKDTCDGQKLSLSTLYTPLINALLQKRGVGER